MARFARQALQVAETGRVTKRAHLYLDMLRLLTMIGDHQKADFALIKQWHTYVKTYMDLMVAED